MTSTATGLTRTPLRLDDAPAVLALANREDERWLGEPMMDLEDLIGELRSPELNLEADTSAVRTTDGRLIAAVILGPRGHLQLHQDPALAPPPLADELTTEFEEQARARGLPIVQQYVPRADTASAARLTARGYHLDYTAWILRLTDDAALATRELPPGYSIRPFAPADAEPSSR